MKVSFTQKEFSRLLELVHLGLTVAGSRPDDPATMPERYSDLAQKVFGLAEPFTIDSASRQRLLEGKDEIDLILNHEPDIAAFERQRIDVIA